MRRIKAVTFDLWDTLVVDDSDEPKRAAQGMPTKPEERLILVHQALCRHQPIARHVVDVGYETTNAACRHAWYEESVTWTVRERLAILLRGLGRELPEEELAILVQRHETMELDVKPDMVPGAAETLRTLGQRYRLGVISDTIFSPGWAVRELLRFYGILDCFEHMVFSDEVRRSKPHRKVFELAAEGLGVELAEMVHIGDREDKDTEGARLAGARGVLMRVAKDRGEPRTAPDALCDDYGELPGILERLDCAS